MSKPQPCMAIALELAQIFDAIERISSSTILPLSTKGTLLQELYLAAERLVKEYEACIKG